MRREESTALETFGIIHCAFDLPIGNIELLGQINNTAHLKGANFTLHYWSASKFLLSKFIGPSVPSGHEGPVVESSVIIKKRKKKGI